MRTHSTLYGKLALTTRVEKSELLSLRFPVISALEIGCHA